MGDIFSSQKAPPPPPPPQPAPEPREMPDPGSNIAEKRARANIVRSRRTGAASTILSDRVGRLG